MQTPFKVTLRSVNDSSCVAVEYLGGLQPKVTDPKPSIWILDTSSSMSDSISALNEVCSAAYNQMKIKPQVISFNTSARHISMGDRWVNLRVDGNTCFVDAFDKMTQLAQSREIRDADVLFFTDGGHNSGANLDNCLERTLWPFLRKNSLRLHVIGYGQSYDLNVMKRLVGSAKENSFQYAPDKAFLANVINNISALAESTIDLTIQGDPLQETYHLSPTGDMIYVFNLEKGLEKLQIRLTDGRNFDCTVSRDETELSSEEELRFIEAELKTIARAPNSKLVESLDARLTTLHLRAASLKGLQRKFVFGKILELKQVVASIYAVLRNSASKEDHARLLATANPIRTAVASLDKRLDKRILDQADLRNKAEVQILEKLKTIDFKQVPADANEYVCPLSTSNYWEALADGDCIGITVIVRRPPSGIANASMLQILSVNSQFMSVQGFTDALQSGLLKAVDENQVHGGFNNTGTVIKDRAIQPCNAILPIYISERHWETVARYRMPLALGFMTTLDERGYASDQWHSVPYLILFQAMLQKPTTELETRVSAQIKRTCQALVKRETLDQEINDWLTQLRNLRLNRTVLGNIRVLLGKLLTIDCQLDHETSLCLYLEELRRIVRRPGPSVWQERLAEYLKVTYETDPNSWTRPKLEDAKCRWLADYLKLELTDTGLYYAWALAHCDDEQATLSSGCPSPLKEPEQVWKWLFTQTQVYCVQKNQAAVARMMGERAACEYLSQVSPVCNMGPHLYSVTFGRFLRSLRRVQDQKNALVNAAAKLNHLKSLGWSPSRRNMKAFQRQIDFQNS